jgi:polyisoprenyl-teichoic acid--peptidoglycan teichoic acid transferase
MAKKNKHQPPKEFDIHRTLPRHRHTSRDLGAIRGRDPERWDDYSSDIEDQGPGEPPKKRRSKFKRRLALFLLLVLGFFLFIGIWDARNFSSASQKMFGSGNLISLLSPSSLKGSDQGRVNVLVAGYSADDPGHPGASLTDSIMLLSMSTTNRTGYMLSIPRDLYVKIPGNGYGKINEAYRDGGMPLLEQIVGQNFQVPIDYYALVNYASVRETVNALGGITVNIQSPDPRGLFDPNISKADGGPLNLPNGPQTLDGQTALNLTRARGDPCGCGQYAYGFPQSDFNRTQNQRLVFSALKDKANNKMLILNPYKNGKLFNALADNVKTDVKLSEVRQLYRLFTSIPTMQMQSVSLNNFNGQNLLMSTHFEGDTLSPRAGSFDYSQIQDAISQLDNQ